MCVLWILTRLKNSLGLYLSTTWRHVTIFHSTFYDLIYMENGKYCPVLSQFFEQQKVIFYRNIRWHYLKCPFEHWIEIPYLVNSLFIGHNTKIRFQLISFGIFKTYKKEIYWSTEQEFILSSCTKSEMTITSQYTR